MKHSKRSYIFLVLIVIQMSCGVWVGNPQETDSGTDEGKANVQPELSGISSANPALAMNLLGTFKATTALTVESLRLPVYSLNLQSDTGTHAIYACTTEEIDACRLEMVGTVYSNVLPANIGEVAISAGTYTRMRVDYAKSCDDTSVSKAILRASGSIDGTVYYTNATSGVSTAGPAEDIAIDFFQTCTSNILSRPVVLKDGDDISVRSFFDLRDLVSLERDRGASGCTSQTDETVKFCTSAPEITPVIDKGTPTIERYRLDDIGTNREGCFGMLGLLFDSSGLPFGGYLRGAFSETQDCGGSSIGGGGNLHSIKVNDDGTIHWGDGVEFGSSDAYNEYSAFQRNDHEGTASIRFGDAAIDRPYKAHKMD